MIAEKYAEKSFDSGELTLNYAEGPANGPAMLLLHGMTRNWQAWQTMMPALTPLWHLYACDLRGHGKSGRDADHYYLNDYVRDITSFLHQQVEEPAVLVGHSLGALTAIGVAAQTPASVRALVLLDPPIFLRNASIELMPQIQFWLNLVYELTSSVHSYEEMVEQGRSRNPDVDEATLRQRAQILYGIAPATVDIMRKNLLLEGFDLGDALSHIECPTLLIQGSWAQGGGMRDEDTAFVQSHLANVTIVKIAEAGHQLTDENSATVLQEMATFLQ